jgi:hypothetical protein
MGCDQPVDDDPTGFELCKWAGFVACYEAAAARNVWGEDRRELSFDRLIGHACSSRCEYSKAPSGAEQFNPKLSRAR